MHCSSSYSSGDSDVVSTSRALHTFKYGSTPTRNEKKDQALQASHLSPDIENSGYKEVDGQDILIANIKEYFPWEWTNKRCSELAIGFMELMDRGLGKDTV
ncbi:hypothetical protein TNCV_352521 [Trichonephila clavipes]|nr:hypothetical protein TNCV_352521 [Trichonephila clavipes]